MSGSIFDLRANDLRFFLVVGAEGVSDGALFPERPLKLGRAQVPCRFLLIWSIWATETGSICLSEQAR